MIQLSKETLALLEDIENRIDPETEEDFVRQWDDFLYDRYEGDLFRPQRKKMTPSSLKLPGININDAIVDYDTMLRAQLMITSAALNHPHLNLCIRANYGTGILSSLFGAEIFMMPRENNTLPTTTAFNDTDKISALVEQGIPDLNGGFGQRVFDFGELCLEVFKDYPKIQKYVEVYHPDVQGPLDITELLWGCEMFYAMYDEPELAHAMISLVTETYTAFLNKWFQLYPMKPDNNPHWQNLRHRGGITLRDDSAMNLSPELYEEYAAPYDGLLLKRFSGGVVHFCGRGDHYMETLCALPGLYGINMSQPHLNDMEKIYRCTVDQGIKILAFNQGWAEKDIVRPGGFHHQMSI